jgi:hypothetical protein
MGTMRNLGQHSQSFGQDFDKEPPKHKVEMLPTQPQHLIQICNEITSITQPRWDIEAESHNSRVTILSGVCLVT